MHEFIEEYGGTVLACVSGVVVIGLIGACITPGNPLGDGVRQLLLASMP